jgi:CRISPR-associated exonuclease Cas4
MFAGGIILTEFKEHTAISDILRVNACPVRFYYEQNHHFCESERYMICKQISYHLGNPLEAEVIWNEVLSVCPGIDPSLRLFLETCITSCNKTEWKPAVQSDVRVISEKHGIVGMVDRISENGNFSIIRATGSMPFGTYAADRLRVAGIAFCIEEMTGNEVSGGNVEYIPDGVSRFHTVQPRDRRQVIAALHKIREIRRGELPRHPLNAPCNRCTYKELLSDLL